MDWLSLTPSSSTLFLVQFLVEIRVAEVRLYSMSCFVDGPSRAGPTSSWLKYYTTEKW